MASPAAIAHPPFLTKSCSSQTARAARYYRVVDESAALSDRDKDSLIFSERAGAVTDASSPLSSICLYWCVGPIALMRVVDTRAPAPRPDSRAAMSNFRQPRLRRLMGIRTVTLWTSPRSAYPANISPPPLEQLVGIHVVAPRHDRYRRSCLRPLRLDPTLQCLRPAPPSTACSHLYGVHQDFGGHFPNFVCHVSIIATQI
jgi:hypothetical protein